MTAVEALLPGLGRETVWPGLSSTTSQAEAVHLASAEPGLGTRGVLVGKEPYSGQGFARIHRPTP